MSRERQQSAEAKAPVLQTAAIWRMRRGSAEWTADDEAAFEAWLAEDELHARAYDRGGKVWDFVDHHAANPELMVLRRDALDRAQKAARGRMARWEGRSVRLPRRGAMAAAAALALFVAGGGYVLAERGDVYSTGRNERRVVNLEDGSRVSLDALSRVSVKYSGEARRLTLLKGQARFDVAHDAARPFSVRARDRSVVATGTAFNIDIFGQGARVTLIEGRVVVLPAPAPTLLGRPIAPPKEKPIALHAGEQLVVAEDAASRVVEAVDLREATAWQQGKLMFDKEPLAQAVARMNRYSDRKIVVGDAAAAAIPISGAFDAGNTRGFLEAVTAYLPVTASEGDKGIVLSSALDRS